MMTIRSRGLLATDRRVLRALRDFNHRTNLPTDARLAVGANMTVDGTRLALVRLLLRGLVDEHAEMGVTTWHLTAHGTTAAQLCRP